MKLKFNKSNKPIPHLSDNSRWDLVLFVAAIVIVSLISTELIADERALYSKAPKDSAFIRLISTSGKQKVALNGKSLSSPGNCHAGNYIYLPPRKYRVNSKSVSWQGNLEANKAYSLVVDNDTTYVLHEDLFRNRLKGMLSVYNLSESEVLSIKTTRGERSVFSEIKTRSLASRLVNPTKLSLSIYRNQQKDHDSKSGLLRRGAINTLLICDANKGLASHWVTN